MEYNIWFNICGLVMLLALLVLYYMKFQAPFLKYKFFVSLVWMALISTVSSVCNNTLVGIAPVWVLRTTNILYFVSHGLIPPLLMLYVYSLTDYSLRTWQRLVPWMIPTAFSMMLIITSWFADTIFWLDPDGTYHRGPLMPLLYLITAFNFAGIAYTLIRNKRVVPPKEWGSVLLFLLLSSSAVLIQLFFPWLLVENFAAAVCMMISQLMVQNPELIMDGSMQMLNKQGFSDLVTPLFEKEQPFQLGFLMIDNYHELEKIYGFNRLESQVSVLVDFLRQHPGIINARIDNRLFCFVPQDFRAGRDWNNLLDDLDENGIVTHLRQNHVGLHFQVKLGTMSCPQDVDSFGALTEIIEAASKMTMVRSQDVMRLTAVDMMRLRRRKVVDELVRSAIKDNSLSLVYQPVYNVAEDRFCSAEALLRMHTEKLGAISPAEFIRIAEENGAILELTKFVVESVCRFIRTAELDKLNLRRIHINLSAIDCAQGDLSTRILDSLRRNGVNPENVSVEITETAFSSLPDSILANLTDLSRAGISIMLDDYGTGYSNLSRLYSMPLDVVKLDKSLVDDINTPMEVVKLDRSLVHNVRRSEAARIVLENTIHMMRRLNRQILVEGVETKEQADYLIGLGVNYIQGYYYARPMEPAKLEELFRKQMEKQMAN